MTGCLKRVGTISVVIEMKKFTIIGGVNGVGKSSLYGALDEDYGDLGIIIDVDKITAHLGGNKLKGGKEAVRIINSCLEHGKNFTQETTLAGQKTLKTILAAREKGYRIHLYYIAVGSAEESLLRIKNRVRKGGHDIPTEDVRRRFENRFDDLLRVLPYCDETYIFDNENGFVRVAEYRDGCLTLSGKLAPDWILALKEILEKRI